LGKYNKALLYHFRTVFFEQIGYAWADTWSDLTPLTGNYTLF